MQDPIAPGVAANPDVVVDPDVVAAGPDPDVVGDPDVVAAGPDPDVAVAGADIIFDNAAVAALIATLPLFPEEAPEVCMCCNSSLATYAFVPCGHFGVCDTCFQDVERRNFHMHDRCYICRRATNTEYPLVKIYKQGIN